MKRTHICELKNLVGKGVSISGWVDVRRGHGKLIFLDIRDESGKVQAVALPNHKEAHEKANRLRPEWVIEASGKVNERPEKMKTAVPNGGVELELTQIIILNQSVTMPFNISSDGKEIDEEVRLKYRYADLKRDRLKKNIKSRHLIIKFIRDFLSQRNFIEVETPILTKSTPEGARDYVVPSRVDKGKFYALPQSPQQYKQLLMTSGLEKYFQIARCMRDEDTRGDRQPEFTQLDMEMSFTSKEAVMALNEELLITLVEKILPEKKIQKKPFPIMAYKEAQEKYKTDRPDLRLDKNDKNELAFVWIVDFPFFEKTADGKWTFTHNPFSAPKDEHKDLLLAGDDIQNIIAAQYDIVLNGLEIGGGSIRAHQASVFEKVMDIIGYDKQAVVDNFQHMIDALNSGTPPHGGIAWGLDRLISILLDEPNIREVIAFPKTGEGRDPMMKSPAKIDDDQLKELGIKINKG